jgi:hypothetical protein
MGPIRCPETSVNNYHSTLRNIPEERRSQVHRGGSLKSRLEHEMSEPYQRVSKVKRRGGSDHLDESSGEVKNAWSPPSTTSYVFMALCLFNPLKPIGYYMYHHV